MYSSQPFSALTASPSHSRLRLSICSMREPWQTIGSWRRSSGALVTLASPLRMLLTGITARAPASILYPGPDSNTCPEGEALAPRGAMAEGGAAGAAGGSGTAGPAPGGAGGGGAGGGG